MPNVPHARASSHLSTLSLVQLLIFRTLSPTNSLITVPHLFRAMMRKTAQIFAGILDRVCTRVSATVEMCRNRIRQDRTTSASRYAIAVVPRDAQRLRAALARPLDSCLLVSDHACAAVARGAVGVIRPTLRRRGRRNAAQSSRGRPLVIQHTRLGRCEPRRRWEGVLLTSKRVRV